MTRAPLVIWVFLTLGEAPPVTAQAYPAISLRSLTPLSQSERGRAWLLDSHFRGNDGVI